MLSHRVQVRRCVRYPIEGGALRLSGTVGDGLQAIRPERRFPRLPDRRRKRAREPTRVRVPESVVCEAPGAARIIATSQIRNQFDEQEGGTMLYLSRFSYTPETWARLIGNPEDRRKAAQSYIESVGGKLHGFWYGFGSHDGYNLWEAPDNVSMAAVALAISGGGALSSFETTVLLTVDETIDALRKAEQIRYRTPGA